MLVTQALNIAMKAVLLNYYANAPHRQAQALSNPVDGEKLHYFRALCGFEPAAPFCNELISSGFHPRIFRLVGPEANYLLHPWLLTTTRAIEYYCRHRWSALDKNDIFVGHSAGGFTVYFLAAIANGAEFGAVRAALSDLGAVSAFAGITEDRFQRLAAALEGSLFFSIATPFNGVTLTPRAEPFYERFVKPRAPLLIESLRIEFLDKLYETVGFRPAEVMSGHIVSDAAPLELSRGPLSLPFEAVIQSGMRFIAKITEFESYDGIAPWSATYMAGVPVTIVQRDHLRLVETAEIARKLVALISLVEHQQGPHAHPQI